MASCSVLYSLLFLPRTCSHSQNICFHFWPIRFFRWFNVILVFTLGTESDIKTFFSQWLSRSPIQHNLHLWPYIVQRALPVSVLAHHACSWLMAGIQLFVSYQVISYLVVCEHHLYPNSFPHTVQFWQYTLSPLICVLQFVSSTRKNWLLVHIFTQDNL